MVVGGKEEFLTKKFIGQKVLIYIILIKVDMDGMLYFFHR